MTNPRFIGNIGEKNLEKIKDINGRSEMIMMCLMASVFYFYGIFSLMPWLPNIDWRITGGTLVLLNQIDQWTTRRFIRKGHREGNPIWSFVFKKIGIGILSYIIITGVIVLIVLLLWEKIGIAGHLALVINAILTIIYNIIVTKKIKISQAENLKRLSL